MSKDGKQYGLILTKKQLSAPKVCNVFGDDNLSDEEEGTDWVRKALKAEGEKNKVKKQTKLNMQKALEEDPTIYQYDEVYEDMERTKNKAVKKEVVKPKYIHNLLISAERRKKEQEHRIERMVQKEREAEGSMFADKESFVTSSYRAKLEEFKKMEEEEARMDRLEAIGDVTKQQDMSGFYRHLYGQTVDNNTEKVEEKKDEGIRNKDSTENNETDVSKSNEKIVKAKKSRQYRQRVVDADSDSDFEENEEEKDKSETLKDKAQCAVDSEEPEKKKRKQVEEKAAVEKNQKEKVSEVVAESKASDVNNDKEIKRPSNDKNIDNNENKENVTSEPVKPAKKDRSSIWQKRTVGAVFEAALERYYARKAMRLSSS